MLTDTSTHNVTTSGVYAYNTWQPSYSSFPSVGQSFTDPTFGATVTTGSVVRRLTNIGEGTSAAWQHYSFHNINVSSQWAFNAQSGLALMWVSSGATAIASVPSGTSVTEVRWDMVSSNIYWFYSGANLCKYNVHTSTSSIAKTFSSSLGTQGGSVNYQSADGRYFVVNLASQARVYDISTDTLYTGGVTPAGGGGWMGMTPDGLYIYGGGYTPTTLGDKFYAFPIYHSSQTVSTTGIMVWDLCGDHGNAVVGSNGVTYLCTFACNSNDPGIYVITMSTDRESMTEAQQQASALMYVPLSWDDQETLHISAVTKGTNKDWVFASTENETDVYGGAQPGWVAYTQEIFALSVSTQEVRRFAHHRSRSLGDSYQQQPRVTCSPDGNFVMWASNFGASTEHVAYSDYYGIEDPFGTAGGGGEPPATTKYGAMRGLA